MNFFSNCIFFLIGAVSVFILPLDAGIRQIELQTVLNRTHAYFIIKDYASACSEVASALKMYPQERSLYELYIKALAYAGDEKSMWTVWNRYQNQFPNEALANTEICESMAWGTIAAAIESPLPMIRLCALLGSFFGDDAKSPTDII